MIKVCKGQNYGININQQVMHPYQEVEIAKIYLNLKVCKGKTYNKNAHRTTASKVLKYHHSKNNSMLQETTGINSIKFNDSQHFYALNGNNHYHKGCSNLLQRSENRLKQKQIINQKSDDLKIDTSRKPSSRIFNADFTQSSLVINEKLPVGQATKNKARPKSSLDRFNPNRKLGQTINSQTKIEKPTNNINPYTHKEYLYFRRKSTEKAKQKVEQEKRKQLQLNMMKPCQIFPKQITVRQILTDISRPQIPKYKQKKLYIQRTLTSRLNKQDHFLQPWEYNFEVSQEEPLN